MLLKAIKSYWVYDYYDECLGNGYYRAAVRIVDSISNQTYDGMAEGQTAAQAKIRAHCEAYERMCFQRYNLTNKPQLKIDTPYGLGVSFFSNNAKIRAIGEYYERKDYKELLFSRYSNNKSTVVEVRTWKNYKVYVAATKDSADRYGTGYGKTKFTAINSAERNLIRKKDYNNKHKEFDFSKSPPQLIDLTPAVDPWLKCYYFG